MKNTKRRLLSLILTLCMTLSLLPAPALAAAGDIHTVSLYLQNLSQAGLTDANPAEDNLQFTFTEGTPVEFTITPETDYTLPATFDLGAAGTLTGAATDGDAAENYYNSTTGKVHLAVVTQDLGIAAFGDRIQQYTVTLHATGVDVGYTDQDATADGVQVYVNSGESLDVTLTLNAGYVLPTSIDVGGVTVASETSETHDEAVNYYAPNEDKVHLASVTADVAVTVTGVAQPRYVLSLFPGNSMANHEAGETGVNFNITLGLTNYTSEIANFGDIQFYNITIDYGAGLIYDDTTPAASSYGDISVDTANHTITLRRLDASSNAENLTGDDVRRTITLGSVHFNLPSGSYVDANGIQGVSVITPAVSDASTITSPGTQVSVQPVYTGGKIYVRHTKLTIPAFDHATVSYKISSADAYTDVAKGESATGIYVPYAATPTFKITTDPGYTLIRAGVHYYNDAADVSQIYTSQVYGSTAYDSSINTSAPLSGDASPYEVTANTGMYMDSTLKLTIYETENTVTYRSGYGTPETTYGTAIYKLSTQAFSTRETPLRAGYTFLGWKVTGAGSHYATAADQTAYFALDNTYGASASVPLDNAYGDVTLTAQWSADAHSNTYDPSVTQTSPNDGATPPVATTPKTDDTVAITITPPTGKQLTGLAITGTDSEAVPYSPAVDAKTAGPQSFTFSQPATGAAVTPTFSNISYSVTYATDGGTAVAAGTYTVETGSFQLPTAPIKTGYTFAGWKVTGAGSQAAAATDKTAYFSADTAYASGTAVTLDNAYGDVTLTAQWTAAAHTGNAYGDGVTQTSPHDGAEPPAATNPKTGDIVVVTVPTREGYTITLPTVTKQDGSNTPVAVNNNNDSNDQTWSFQQPEYDVTVTPNYTANSYNVTLDPCNTSGTTASLAVFYDSSAIGTIEVPSYTGYTFAGWYTADGSGTLVINADGTFAAPVTGYTGTENNVTVWKVTGATTLYAHWTGNSQNNAAFPTGDGATYTSPDNSYFTAKTGDTVTITVTAPTGYYLSSLYYKNADDSGYNTSIGSTQDRTAHTFTFSQPAYGVKLLPTYSGRDYYITLHGAANATIPEGTYTLHVRYGATFCSGTTPAVTIAAGYHALESDTTRIGWAIGSGSSVAIFSTLFAQNGSGGTLKKVSPYVDEKGIWCYDTTETLDAYPLVSPDRYPIDFELNGGSPAQGTTLSETIYFGYYYSIGNGNYSLPTKTGYTFGGWYVDSTLTARLDMASHTDTNLWFNPNVAYNGTAYTGYYEYTNRGETTVFGPWCYDAGEDGTHVTLYAKWEPAAHTGNTLNGVTTDPANPATDASVNVTVPEKPGYTKGGITVTPAGGASYNVTTANENGTYSYTQPAADVTITPIYDAISYTLTYVHGNGTADTIANYTTESGTVTFPTAPTRDGYDFEGWLPSGSAVGAFAASTDALTDSSVSLGTGGTSYGSATLTASWAGKEQTNLSFPTNDGATYNSPDGSYTKPPHTGDSVFFTITAPAGMYLSGLKLTDVGGTPTDYKVYTDEEIQIGTKPTTAMTFTFIQPAYGVQIVPTYSGRTYTITLSTTGVTPATSLTGNTTFTVTYGSGEDLAGMPTVSTAVGYTATGFWYEIPNVAYGAEKEPVLIGMGGLGGSEGSFNSGSVYTTAIKPTAWNYAGNVTLYPQITGKTTTVTLDANGGTLGNTTTFSATYDAALAAAVSAPAAPAGYTFAGWTVTKNGTDFVVTAAGTAYAACTGYTSADETPVWKYDSSALTLYAKWTPIVYTLHLNTNGGTGGTASATVAYGAAAITVDGTLTAPTRTGYTFGGWTSQPTYQLPTVHTDGILEKNSDYADADGKWTRLAAIPESNEVTLYAVWSAVGYTVSLNANGGSGGDTSFTAYYETSDASITSPTRTGYLFAGWFDAATGGSPVVTSANALAGVVTGYTDTKDNAAVWKILSNDKTLYAHWTAETYTVTLSAADASTAGDTGFSATYDAAVPGIAAQPTRSGYTLAGWYTTAANDGVKVLNADGSAANDGAYTADGKWIHDDNGTALTLYARWTLNHTTVTITYAGDANYSKTYTIYYGDKTFSFPAADWPSIGGNQYVKSLYDSDGYYKIFQRSASSYTLYGSSSYGNSVDGWAYCYAGNNTLSMKITNDSLEYMGVTITLDSTGAAVPGTTTLNAYGYNSFTVGATSNPITIPTRPGYTLNGYYTAKSGGTQIINSTGYLASASLAIADVGTITRSASDPTSGTATLYAQWTVTSNLLTVTVTDANSKAAGTAVFAPDSGVDSGTGGDAGKYFITAAASAAFTVTPAAGYKVDAVSYAPTDGTGSGTAMTAENGVYAIPASACVVPLTVTVTTVIDSAKITADAVIVTKNNATVFQTYSHYSDNRSLVLFSVADGTTITGLALSNGVSVYRTNAYEGYQYAALLNLTEVDKTPEALNTYLHSLLMTTTKSNTVLDNNSKNVNGKAGFTIDDISVEYDYSSLDSGGFRWVPYDAYLIIGDVAGAAAGSTADRVLDSYDVAAFVTAYAGT